MVIQVITPPAASLLTAADTVLRQHLHLEADESDQDELVSDFCAAAQSKIENEIRQYLQTQTIRLTSSGHSFRGARGFALEVSPITSISRVAYLGQDGAEIVLPDEEYRLHQTEIPNLLLTAREGYWPADMTASEEVRIDLEVGFEGVVAGIPRELIAAIRFLVAYWLINREVASESGFEEMPHMVTSMITPHIFWF
ncbi:MAG: hypothetical protein JKY94_08060 [Rhodobacteraceae bacterium]|nr:hypothetical protein [Paracoccaceae bacterium]